MALWWVVNEQAGKRRVFVQEASTQLYAQLKSSIAGFDGDFVEAIKLDDKRARRILPKSRSAVRSI